MSLRPNRIDRRRFLGASLATTAGLGWAAPLAASPLDAAATAPTPPLGKAEHCILLWLGGGAAQVDTWDPKRLGDAEKRVPGSYYEAIPTAIPGERVCKHLARSAPLLDRATLVRSVHHDVIDEHAAAVNRMHTGRPTSGTIVYPSMGSAVSALKGQAGRGVPAYVVAGYPNLTRGPGFLGAKHGYVYLTDTESGPTGLTRPPTITASREARRRKLLDEVREELLRRGGDDEKIREWIDTSREAFRLAGPEFLGAFRLDDEKAELRESYGSEFGQRCLLARRLVERGVRFVEVAHNLNFVNGTGWDTHNEGQLRQHVLIEELDRAFSSLLLDLEERRLLERTLIVISTEFGRPPEFDGGGGRGHQPGAFSVVLAGGGLRGGRVVGRTDELAKTIVDEPVSVPDLFATIYHALGIEASTELYAGDRPVPLTDGGVPIARLFG